MADCAQLDEKQALLPDTTYGAVLRGQLNSAEQIKPSRQTVASVSLISLSLTWIGVFLVTGQINETLAWSFTFFALTAVTIAWTCSSRSNPLHMFKIGESRWATLAGSLATTLAIFSVLLGGWILTHGLPSNRTMEVKRQIVDIILVAPNDYADRHDVLPSTKPTEIPNRDVSRQGTPINIAPSIKAKSAPTPTRMRATAPALGTRNYNMEGTESNNTHTATADPAFVIRQQPIAQPAARGKTIAKTVTKPKVESAPPELEEVAPPQIFEVTDNQSERASEVSQSGGHSTGGSGSQTLLVSYLRDLHRRIKKAWSPGVDDITTSSAQILFRIRKKWPSRINKIDAKFR